MIVEIFIILSTKNFSIKWTSYTRPKGLGLGDSSARTGRARLKQGRG